MKRVFRSMTSAVVCLSLSVPTGPIMAEATVNECVGNNETRAYPCRFHSGKIVRNEKQFTEERDAVRAAREAEKEKAARQAEKEKAARQEARKAEEEKAARQAEKEKAARQAEQEKAARQAEREKAARQEARKAEEEKAARQAEKEKVARQEARKAEEEKAARQAAAAERRAEETKAARQEARRLAEEKAARQAAAADRQAEAEKLARQEARQEEEDRAARQAALVERRKEDARLARLSEAERQRERRERRLAYEARQAEAARERRIGEGILRRERLTEENTRSSSQEYVSSDKKKKDKGGLSDLEKLLLLGLGAVAVGSLLNNGDQVVDTSQDRVVVNRDGQLHLLKDDNALLRRPGNDISTETYSDGSSRTIVSEPDGSQVVTIRAADGRVLSRTRITPQGEAISLFDDTVGEVPVVVSELPRARNTMSFSDNQDAEQLRRALLAAQGQDAGRRFSLRQIREIPAVRELAPEIELQAVSFPSGSAAIQPRQAESLAQIGRAIAELVEEDPRTIVLVEGHADAVGDEAYNLALSDRRAETMALAMSEYFGVPAENMIVQGYGESDLKVDTQEASAINRRVVVRNITGLLQ